MNIQLSGTGKPNNNMRLKRWFNNEYFSLFREMRWSYAPPMMVYLAAGVSAFTGIIESFYVKEELGLSAAFLASLGFWAGLPWALKMPLGHLVDIHWHKKSLFIYFGAVIMAASLLIMVGLTGYKNWMQTILPVNIWYVISALLSPIGFILQDVVADAMTVEAVPHFKTDGVRFSDDELQRMHVTVQTLGRIAILGGSAGVAGLGGWLAHILSYATMYWMSLVIPAISVMGVVIGGLISRLQRKKFRLKGFSKEAIYKMTQPESHILSPNYYILVGSAIFVVITLGIGLSKIVLKEEIIFCSSLLIIGYLINQLLHDMEAEKRREIIGIAIIIFVFRAMPTSGAGAGWWQIDVLQFDEPFFGTLRQISAILAIFGMIALRVWMSKRPIPYLVVFLSLYSTVMFLPFLGMYYGLHLWTAEHLGFGARTIAIVDTMADSPLGQVAMIPMLAWIAKEAPDNQKATYFAIMAAFTNLALSASQLFTKYLNEIFVIERGNYDELGMLMTTVAAAGLVVPVLTVMVFRSWAGKS